MRKIQENVRMNDSSWGIGSNITSEFLKYVCKGSTTCATRLFFLQKKKKAKQKKLKSIRQSCTFYDNDAVLTIELCKTLLKIKKN